ncbi:zinc finger MYM-type protein 6-like [Sipha flava]|uniref:Zinc finger MYM-type protein 6-like n=1 Tax=Sipha flava TaxID=143950 RepID=A0A8B8FQT6_9HEMI|nr:zinc finger MYM-type protein 6-like [Sipha flava]
MSKQTSLSNFFKQPSTSNSSSAIVNGSDSDVSENELRPPLKKVKLTSKILNYDERYVDTDLNDINEEFLCCLNLPTFCTSEEIFKAILVYFDKNDLSISKCIGICTDGAAAMTGKFNGLVARIKQIAHKDIISTHCFIHREQLATKDMDIFSILNDLNLSLQGPYTNIFTSNNKIEAFLNKIELWEKRLQKLTFDMFPSFLIWWKKK